MSTLGECHDKYYIKECYIFENNNKDNTDGVYIRDIVDLSSHEYKYSRITNKEKYKILSHLGIDILIKTLSECYKNAGMPYDAVKTVKLAHIVLSKEMENLKKN